jgi:hypothetical protein
MYDCISIFYFYIIGKYHHGSSSLGTHFHSWQESSIKFYLSPFLNNKKLMAAVLTKKVLDPCPQQTGLWKDGMKGRHPHILMQQLRTPKIWPAVGKTNVCSCIVAWSQAIST